VLSPVNALRRVTARVAERVVRAARDGEVGKRFEDARIAEAVHEAMWEPQYPELVPE
jgi:hypothetical protein